MCVEKLKQSHDQRFHSYVTLLIFLQVVGHGLPLRLCKQHVGLLLQGHLSTQWAHTSVSSWLEREESERKKYRLQTYRIKILRIFYTL